MTRRPTRRHLLAALAVSALTIAACGGDDDDSADTDGDSGAMTSEAADTDGDTDTDTDGGGMTDATAFNCEDVPETDVGGDLTIYSGRSEELVGPLIDCFGDRSGVDLTVRYGGSEELALQISEEGDSTDADVFFSQTSGALGFLEGEDRLTELPAATLDQVAEEYRSPAGMWVGTSGRIRVFVYNTENVEDSELPATIDDVLDPAWEGRLAVAPSNASFQDFIAAMILERGEQETAAFLEGLVALDPRIEANNVAIVDAVGRGEVDAGLVNHYYGVLALREDPTLPIANRFFPQGDLGSFVLVAGVGILDAGEDHQEQAQAFVDYLLSTPAQEYFANQTGEYPLAGGVAPPEGLPDITSVGIPGYDEGRLGEAIEDSARLIEESGLPTG
jgi:iron(III) transport system substrate-binding protein